MNEVPPPPGDEPTILPVHSTGATIDDDGEHWPTAVIDAANHPDVADLARVHATEGIGDITTEALLVPIENGHVLLLGIRVTRPVTCAFALAFSLPAQRQVLDEAADAGHLLLATTPPEAAIDERPLWLAIDIDGSSLRQVLAGC